MPPKEIEDEDDDDDWAGSAPELSLTEILLPGRFRLFPLHQQHAKHQEPDPGQANRIERHPVDSKPA